MPVLVYDNGAACFFGITLLLLYIFPTSIYIVRRWCAFRAPAPAPPAARTPGEAAKVAALEAEIAAARGVLWTTWFKALVGSVVVSILLVVLLVRTVRGASLAQYDPYTILGLATGAAEREIKNAFRKLSLKHHPDKPGGNAELFQKIAKAYEALTDPAARENYEKFGNPDGRQALEVSIGLPRWMAEGGGKWLFLAGYVSLLLICLPAGLVWCYRRERKNGETYHGVSIASLEWFKLMLNESTRVRDIPTLLAGAKEGELVPVDPVLDAAEMEAGYAPLIKAQRLSVVPFSRAVVSPDIIKRNNFVLHAHLSRVPLQSPALEATRVALLKGVDPLLSLLLEMAVQRTFAPPHMKIKSHLEAAMGVVEAGQRLVQGLAKGVDSAMLQVLPPDTVAALLKAGTVNSLREWLKAGEGPGGAAARPGLAGLSPAAAAEASAVLAVLPDLEVTAVAGVEDEEFIAEGDLMTLSLTLRHKNLAPGAAVAPVYAPRWPLVKKEEWHVFVLSGQGRLLAYHLLVDAVKGLHVEKIRIPAPPTAGKYSYKVVVMSNAYVGLDVETTCVFDVKPSDDVVATTVHEDDEALDGEREMALESFVRCGVVGGWFGYTPPPRTLLTPPPPHPFSPPGRRRQARRLGPQRG